MGSSTVCIQETGELCSSPLTLQGEQTIYASSSPRTHLPADSDGITLLDLILAIVKIFRSADWSEDAWGQVKRDEEHLESGNLIRDWFLHRLAELKIALTILLKEDPHAFKGFYDLAYYSTRRWPHIIHRLFDLTSHIPEARRWTLQARSLAKYKRQEMWAVVEEKLFYKGLEVNRSDEFIRMAGPNFLEAMGINGDPSRVSVQYSHGKEGHTLSWRINGSTARVDHYSTKAALFTAVSNTKFRPSPVTWEVPTKIAMASSLVVGPAALIAAEAPASILVAQTAGHWSWNLAARGAGGGLVFESLAQIITGHFSLKRLLWVPLLSGVLGGLTFMVAPLAWMHRSVEALFKAGAFQLKNAAQLIPQLSLMGGSFAGLDMGLWNLPALLWGDMTWNEYKNTVAQAMVAGLIAGPIVGYLFYGAIATLARGFQFSKLFFGNQPRQIPAEGLPLDDGIVAMAGEPNGGGSGGFGGRPPPRSRRGDPLATRPGGRRPPPPGPPKFVPETHQGRTLELTMARQDIEKFVSALCEELNKILALEGKGRGFENYLATRLKGHAWGDEITVQLGRIGDTTVLRIDDFVFDIVTEPVRWQQIIDVFHGLLIRFVPQPRSALPPPPPSRPAPVAQFTVTDIQGEAASLFMTKEKVVEHVRPFLARVIRNILRRREGDFFKKLDQFLLGIDDLTTVDLGMRGPILVLRIEGREIKLTDHPTLIQHIKAAFKGMMDEVAQHTAEGRSNFALGNGEVDAQGVPTVVTKAAEPEVRPPPVPQGPRPLDATDLVNTTALYNALKSQKPRQYGPAIITAEKNGEVSLKLVVQTDDVNVRTRMMEALQRASKSHGRPFTEGDTSQIVFFNTEQNNFAGVWQALLEILVSLGG
jgi:hypothetical protein